MNLYRRRAHMVETGEPIDINNYLTIEALEDGLTVKLSLNACEYCIDEDNNWVTLAAGTSSPSLNAGQTISFRGNLTPDSSNGIGTFTISKKCNVLGNVMSVLFGDDVQDNFSLSGKNYSFYKLFSNCTNIISAKDLYLPATTLTPYCYYYMFYGCTSLTTAPELPATELADYCYSDMFYGCTSLTTAPVLPATTLATNCCTSMFQGCTSLTTAPELPATTLTSYCYYRMFYGCTSLTTAPELPATTLTTNCYREMFRNCTSLTTAPELPATELADYCYYSMFEGCKSLTTAPELPATTLIDNCYSNMFYGCTSLTTAPELPATTLVQSCYQSMFNGCTSLTTAPELPATRLYSYCYSNMFKGCKSLTTAPALPATRLYSYCYNSMFNGCTSLTTAPELPATTVATYCYSLMFFGCTSLTTAPELPATTLSPYCYNSMFNGCKKLNKITMLATDISASNCLNNWVRSVASTGTFIKHPDMISLPTGFHGIPSGWTVQDIPMPKNQYLTFEALENGMRVRLTEVDYCEYCIDEDMNWRGLSSEDWTESVASGHLIHFKGDGVLPSIADGHFEVTTMFNVMGDVMSLIYGDDAKEINSNDLEVSDFAFRGLFYGCDNLISAENLKLRATTLAKECYSGMFYGCTSLTTAPTILPATTLAEGCYATMFYNCTSLTTALELPATAMADYCYGGMFYNCTSLTTAPELPATTLATNCYTSMFQGCTSLITAPGLPATTLAGGCYTSMFQGCTSLITAPRLPATTLVDYCYSSMFNGCTKLNHIKMLATNISATGCLNNWVENVASTGTFVKHPNMASLPTGTSGIPSGWTVITKNYSVNLNNQWRLSSRISNPNSSTYDGVYESNSNYNIHNAYATMYIDISGYSTFSLYIRSYAESSYDYVMVSQLDQNITGSTSYSNTTLVKSHTRGSQSSSTTIGSHKLVEFTGIDGGDHKITIVYRKDGSGNTGDDRGYVLIPKNQ